MVQSHNWKWLPAISAEEFAEHIEEESFPVQYGNPVRIYTGDGYEYICLTIELYERISGRSIFGGDSHEDKDRNGRSPQGGRRPH